MNESILKKIDWLILPVIGVAVCVLTLEPHRRKGSEEGNPG